MLTHNEIMELVAGAHSQNEKLKVKLTELKECVSFFASVIKAGEPWTETCQTRHDEALEDLK